MMKREGGENSVKPVQAPESNVANDPSRRKKSSSVAMRQREEDLRNRCGQSNKSSPKGGNEEQKECRSEQNSSAPGRLRKNRRLYSLKGGDVTEAVRGTGSSLKTKKEEEVRDKSVAPRTATPVGGTEKSDSGTIACFRWNRGRRGTKPGHFKFLATPVWKFKGLRTCKKRIRAGEDSRGP